MSVSVCNPVTPSPFQASKLQASKPYPRKEPFSASQEPRYAYNFNTDTLVNLATGTLVPAVNTFNNRVIPVARQYAPTPQELGRNIALSAIPYSNEVLAAHSACRTIATEYRNTQQLPPKERSKKVASKAIDTTLFQLLGTFAIPAMLATRVNRWVAKTLQSPRIPNAMKTHPTGMTILALGVIGGITTKPMNALANFILDWTYRPMVEEKRRKEFLKAQAELKKKALDYQQKGMAYQASKLRSYRTPTPPTITNTIDLPVAAAGA